MTDQAPKENLSSRIESSTNPTEYRVVKKTWVMTEFTGEGPVEGDNEIRSKGVLLNGKTKNIKGLDVKSLGMTKDKYPTENFDPNFGPQVGDATFSYELQVLRDGEWKFEDTLQPYEQPKSQEE